jgi:non-heme chloroperoxidase
MQQRAVKIGVVGLLLACGLSAQDLSGNWQGTLKSGSKDLRAVIEIAKLESGGWKAVVHTDQTTEVLAADSVTLEGSHVKVVIDPVDSAWEGTISADGASITGTWKGSDPGFLGTQGQPQPLELRRATKETAWQIDPTNHKIQFIDVDKNVRLEVLDWGGSGRTLLLAAGSGNTAHTFDKMAPKLAANYHVYGITRRGFGASSAPEPTAANYMADRLGDDVIAIMDALKLNKPVLIGHSMGGEELSSVASRFPEKIAGLIYLDAAYHYAYYDKTHGDLIIDRNEVRRKLAQLEPGMQPQLPGGLIHELLETDLPALEKDLREDEKKIEGTPAMSAQPLSRALSRSMAIGFAMQDGMQKYMKIPVPALAIYAIPHNRGIRDPVAREKADAEDMEISGVPAKAFEAGVPSRVVLLPHASHFVFLSNEADVLREINSFLSTLP